MKSDKTFLLILGGTGTAKTCIARIMMLQYLKERFEKIKDIFQVIPRAQYIRALDFFDELKKTFEEKEATTQLINWTSRYGLLIVDEVGATYGTQNEVVQFNRLCDNFYVNQNGKMVMISNCKEEEISKYISAPAYSRICEAGLILDIQSEDFRKKNREKVIFS